MPVHAPQEPTMARSTGPKAKAQTEQEQGWLALSASEDTSAPECHRATPEEIDQIFAEQLAAKPHSSFLREMVADRLRRRRGNLDVGC
jgi:hypothetical protein